MPVLWRCADDEKGWRSSLRNHVKVTHSHVDPFADPVGARPGASVGLVDDDEESGPIAKP
jgi:hypothetical protein